MSTYNQVKHGSSGDDVLELQRQLNANGYSLKEDGVFGSATQSAVMDYQTNNKLTVDGIVGDQTWGSLYSSGTSAGQTTTAPAATPAKTEEAKTPAFSYEAYKPSDTVKQAEALLQQQLANKPGEYTSAWQAQLNDTLQQILNREKFSYDLNGDALYQQYKGQYTTQGKMAMMDTMGQAQAMTGGYGNSYAQSVGQQAYQGYLQQLNDKVPELYQLALNQYNAEGDALYDQASLMASMEEQDYGRYRDQMSDYYAELDRLAQDSRYQAEQDYGKWMDQTNLDYGIHRDTIADQQWQTEFDEAQRQYNEQFQHQQDREKVADEQWQKTFDEGVRQFNKEHSLNVSKEGLTGGSDDEVAINGITRGQIKEMQAWYGTEADGVWGKNSTSASGGRTVEEAWDHYTKLKELLSPSEAQMVIRGDRNEIVEHFRSEYLNLRKLLNADTSLQGGKAQSKLDAYLAELMEAGVLLKYEDQEIRDSRS